MAWSDEPTDTQIDAVLRMLKWQIREDERTKIADYLKDHCTRRDISSEMGRLRNLAIEKGINHKTAFESEIWEDYKRDSHTEEPTKEQITLICSILKKYVGFTIALVASKWAENNSTKDEVSREIDRLKDLEKHHRLDKNGCFEGSIWTDFRSTISEH